MGDPSRTLEVDSRKNSEESVSGVFPDISSGISPGKSQPYWGGGMAQLSAGVYLSRAALAARGLALCILSLGRLEPPCVGLLHTRTCLWQDTSHSSVSERSKSGTKKEPKPKLLSPDIFWWGGGLPREGVGAKNFCMSLETQGIKLFWRDIPGFCRDIPEAPEKFEKKCLGSILVP